MVKKRSEYRRTWRSVSRRHSRRATRTAVRVRWRAPDTLGTALACYRRAIIAHRRLARLAPRFFDSAVVDRERREDEARRRRRDAVKAALMKVYGAEAKPAPRPNELPPLPSPRIQAAVECQLACQKLYLAAGREALQRFRFCHPHALPSLNRLARWIEIATDLGRLATGLDSTQPPTEPVNDQNFWADLERIYGDPHDLTPSA